MAFRDATEGGDAALTPEQRRTVERENEQEQATPTPSETDVHQTAPPPAPATPEGETPPAEPPKRKMLLRDQIIEQVAQRVSEERKASLDGEPEANEPEAEQPQSQPQQKPQQPADHLQTIEPIKVDGQEFTVSRSQMLQAMPELAEADPRTWARSFQVFAASQKRLQEAAIAKAAAQQSQPQPQQEQAPDRSEPAPPKLDQDRREAMLEFFKTVQFGTPEEALEKWETLSGAANPVDANEIRRIAAEAAARQATELQFQEKRRAEIAEAMRKHADLLNDPDYTSMAVNRIAQEIALDLKNVGFDPIKVDRLTPEQQSDLHMQVRIRGAGRPLTAIFDAATSPIRQKLAPVLRKTDTPSLSEKRAAKASMTPAPAPASTRAVIPSGETRKQTNAEVVAQMRRARGQSVQM